MRTMPFWAIPFSLPLAKIDAKKYPPPPPPPFCLSSLLKGKIYIRTFVHVHHTYYLTGVVVACIVVSPQGSNNSLSA